MTVNMPICQECYHTTMLEDFHRHEADNMRCYFCGRRRRCIIIDIPRDEVTLEVELPIAVA